MLDLSNLHVTSAIREHFAPHNRHIFTQMPSAVVGALACQKDSFLRTFQSVVLSCLEYTPPQSNRTKKNTEAAKGPEYAIEVEDTVLFPEGGGQPSDTGSFVLPDDSVVPVTKVIRDKLTARHITALPIEPGTRVIINLDWQKRVDYMQQHTGQHLLSAVFDQHHLETLSWAMGDKINYIELPQKVDESVLQQVSSKVNELIFRGLPLSVVTPDAHGEPIDTSHIPDDYDMSKGIIRIVKIGDMDANPCCGTHLTSTLQIQAIALLHQLNIRGGNSRLHFLCGSRVYKYLEEQNKILKASGALLSCQVDEVTDKIALLNSTYRKAMSRELALTKELANIRASEVLQALQHSPVATVYRSDNSAEYATLFHKELATLLKDNTISLDTHTVVFINGDYASGQGGSIKISGPQAQDIAQQLQSRITNLKGGGKGTLFQGKIPKYLKGELELALAYLELL